MSTARNNTFADEIEKVDRLKKSGAITAQEFARLRMVQ
jgi:hypothetical protein